MNAPYHLMGKLVRTGELVQILSYTTADPKRSYPPVSIIEYEILTQENGRFTVDACEVEPLTQSI